MSSADFKTTQSLPFGSTPSLSFDEPGTEQKAEPTQLSGESNLKVTNATVASLKQLQDRFQLTNFLEIFVATLSLDTIEQDQRVAADKLAEIVAIAKQTFPLLDALKPAIPLLIEKLEKLAIQAESFFNNLLNTITQGKDQSKNPEGYFNTTYLTEKKQAICHEQAIIKKQREELGLRVKTALKQLESEVCDEDSLPFEDLFISQATQALPLHTPVMFKAIHKQQSQSNHIKAAISKIQYLINRVDLNIASAEMFLKMVEDMKIFLDFMKKKNPILKNFLKELREQQKSRGEFLAKLDRILTNMMSLDEPSLDHIPIDAKSFQQYADPFNEISTQSESLISDFQQRRNWFESPNIRTISQIEDERLEDLLVDRDRLLRSWHVTFTPHLKNEWNKFCSHWHAIQRVILSGKFTMTSLLLILKTINLVKACSNIEEVCKNSKKEADHEKTYQLTLDEFLLSNNEIEKEMKLIRELPKKFQDEITAIFECLLDKDHYAEELKKTKKNNSKTCQDEIQLIETIYSSMYTRYKLVIEFRLGAMHAALKNYKGKYQTDFRRAYSSEGWKGIRYLLGWAPISELKVDAAAGSSASPTGSAGSASS